MPKINLFTQYVTICVSDDSGWISWKDSIYFIIKVGGRRNGMESLIFMDHLGSTYNQRERKIRNTSS